MMMNWNRGYEIIFSFSTCPPLSIIIISWITAWKQYPLVWGQCKVPILHSATNSCSCSATSHSTSLLSFPCNTWCAHTTQEVSSRQSWSSGMDGPLRDWLWSMAVPPVSAVPGICLVFLPTGAVNMKTMTYLAVVGQSLTHVQLFVTPAHQASLTFTISQSLLKLMSTEAVMPSNHLILCCPFLLLPSIFPSIRVFPVSQLFTSDGQIIWASASSWVLPMNIQGWFPLGLTSLISLQTRDSQEYYQHHNSKESILQHSTFFTSTTLVWK